MDTSSTPWAWAMAHPVRIIDCHPDITPLTPFADRLPLMHFSVANPQVTLRSNSTNQRSDASRLPSARIFADRAVADNSTKHFQEMATQNRHFLRKPPARDACPPCFIRLSRGRIRIFGQQMHFPFSRHIFPLISTCVTGEAQRSGCDRQRNRGGIGGDKGALSHQGKRQGFLPLLQANIHGSSRSGHVGRKQGTSHISPNGKKVVSFVTSHVFCSNFSLTTG